MFKPTPVPINAVPLANITPMPGLVYIASPYTSPDKLLVQTRQMLVEYATAEALRLGWHVYSPIAHCHNLAERYGLPGHAAFWASYNKTVLLRSDRLWILCLDGWDESIGLKGEVEFARQRDMPIASLYLNGGDAHTLMISQITRSEGEDSITRRRGSGRVA